MIDYPGEVIKEALWQNMSGNELGDYPHKVADKIMDALEEAGYVVTRMPEQVDGHWLVDPDDDDFCVSRVHLVETSTGRGVSGCRVTWGSIELTLSPAHASALAGALLAAVKCGELD